MSENQSLPVSSDVSASNTSDSDTSEQLTFSQTEDWDNAPIPGTLDSVLLANDSSASDSPANDSNLPERERELLTLIHDLNQCNDTLLSRVKQLEDALEKSQSATQKASLEGAQQQIARLVGELDSAEQALSRQTLINENLQIEVGNYQERISQLERECTIVTQQHLEEAQARAKAEAASKDLRSRLQRQQRYTMQFKAALEKSLTVNAKSASTTAIEPVAFNDSAAVAMPKAQRIMPWVSDNSSPFAGIDPHLESLIRGIGKSGDRPSEPNALSQTVNTTTLDSTSKTIEPAEALSKGATDSNTQNQIWQDIERVINHSSIDNGGEKTVAGENSINTKPINTKADAFNATSRQPEPSLNSEPQAQPSNSAQTVESTPQQNASNKNTSEPTIPNDTDDLIHQIERSFATSRQAFEETVEFTEPSPWGTPLAAKQSDNRDTDSSYLPATDGQAGAAISPLVKPLRVSTKKAAHTSRKSSSLSNIELPTFQNAKVASFRS